MNNLKIQLKEVNNELKNKVNEIELIKKNVKVSKISELSQELKVTVEEFKKFKELYIQAELRSKEAGYFILYLDELSTRTLIFKINIINSILNS